jgi:hypothetical protein
LRYIPGMRAKSSYAVRFFALAILVVAALVHADVPTALEQALDRDDPAALADSTLPRLADLDSLGRARLVARLASRPIGERVAAYAFLQIGTPYRLGPLGEETPPDTDPLIEFRATDCTTLNLVSAALAHAGDAGGERQAMATANYSHGLISYATRYHFTTDRLDSCPYFRDITRNVGGKSCRSRWVVLNRRQAGGRWIPIDWTKKRAVVYLPRAMGRDFKGWYESGRVPAAMGIAFVEAGKLADGLDVVHESLLWKGATLVHASSRAGRVVATPWTEFLAGSGRNYDGFVLFDYR